MEKKMLLAVDGSRNGFEVVTIAGQILKDQPSVHLVLFHCVQQMTGLLPGEICSEIESECRLSFTDQEKIGRAVLREARNRITGSGFPDDKIEEVLKLDSSDPAQDILAETDARKIRTIIVGRRGKSQIENLLLGSVSSKVAQYSKDKTVWIIDSPIQATAKVLVALEGEPDSRELARYTAEVMAPKPNLEYTFLHLIPPVPPTFWDDGHILSPSEQKDRQSRVERWRASWVGRIEKFMSEAKGLMVERAVPEEKVQTLILPTKEGIARDLLNEIAEHRFQFVVMGKKSFHERKPFLMGSHAAKVLQNLKGAVLCLVD